MAADTKWEEKWQDEVEEINAANAAKAALTEPTQFHISASSTTSPTTTTPLEWPEDAWFPRKGVRG